MLKVEQYTEINRMIQLHQDETNDPHRCHSQSFIKQLLDWCNLSHLSDLNENNRCWDGVPLYHDKTDLYLYSLQLIQ